MATKLNFGQAGPDANPELSALFRVEIDGIEPMAFEKVKAPTSEHAKGESRTGIDPPYKRPYAGLRNALEVVLEKTLREGGAGDIQAFWDWHASRSKDRRSGTIVQLDIEGEEIHRYSFTGAWVQKIEPPDNDASQESETPTFVITLAVEDFKFES